MEEEEEEEEEEEDSEARERMRGALTDRFEEENEAVNSLQVELSVYYCSVARLHIIKNL